MDTLLRQLGYKEGTIKERMDKLEADSQPPAEADPRPALLTQYDHILRDAEHRAAGLFDLPGEMPPDGQQMVVWPAGRGLRQPDAPSERLTFNRIGLKYRLERTLDTLHET